VRKKRKLQKVQRGFFVCVCGEGGGEVPKVIYLVRKTILSSSHLDAEVKASKQSEIKFIK
jgi:hypothetical protein